MRFFFISLLLPLVSTLVAAEPGTVKFELIREKRSPNTIDLFQHRHRHRLSRRQSSVSNTVQQILDNYSYLYYANITLGTPGQNLRLQIDTGSSDVWVQSGENQVCQERSDPCAESGIFEPEDSSTYDVVASDAFSIRYGDLSYARGDYAQDSFGIGGATVHNLTVGVATNANATEGIMGIGYASNEAIVGQQGPSSQYPNLPELMVQQGLIQSRAYSLWLNDLFASTGTVLFGGIDRAKFSGNLVELPIDKFVGESSPSEFFVTLDGVGFTDTDGSRVPLVTNLREPVLLDSGTSFNYLPDRVLVSLGQAISAQYNENLGFFVQTCAITSLNATIDFNFNGVTIQVPLNELLYPAVTTSGRQLTFENGDPVCLLTVSSNSQIGVSILGDTFLRSAYVVYDLDNAVIGLAQTVFNATDSDIVAIGTGSDAVPGAVVRTTTPAFGTTAELTFDVSSTAPTLHTATGSPRTTATGVTSPTAAATPTSTGNAGARVDANGYSGRALAVAAAVAAFAVRL
ncbi:aspartic peptidase domain-containing protein [Lipomyces arxii]|uniref:aspartic peptidase domain-containing protein n=1 Tax=Lipomyces arxii TaxID=56418 RepID=UPI0034CD944A